MTEEPGARSPGRVEHAAYLALGSNLGDRLGYLQGALTGLAAAPGIEVTAVSRVYETAPVGGPEQGPYLNAVVALRTRLLPAELLAVAHRIEDRAGRVRAERWGARTLDVDVLLVGDARVDSPDLTVPHPRLWERGFVLAPLADVAPHLVPSSAEGWPGVEPVDAVLELTGSSVICTSRRHRRRSMNRILRATAGLFSIIAGILHWDIWAHHGYRETPVRELIIASAVIAVVVGLLAYVDRQPAALPAAVANLVFLAAFGLSRVTTLPTLHGGWSESGLAPTDATYFGISTTLLLVLAEVVAVASGLASLAFGREARARALPSEVLRTA